MVKQASIRLVLATATLSLLILVTVQAEKKMQWIDRDDVYCGHLDCTREATFKGEKFCSPCDSQHYCECLEIREPLPYLRKCAGSNACQSTDRLGACTQKMDAELCGHIDEAYRFL